MVLRTIIVDGDARSRQILSAGVTADSELTLVAECSTGSQMIRAMSDHNPCLAFVDAQLPDLNCLTLAKALCTKALTAVIFLVPPGHCLTPTFDGHAFGYLVKPIADDQLLTALSQAKASINKRRFHEGDLTRPVGALGSSFSNRNRLLIKGEGRLVFVRTEEIDWIQANANYVRVHVGDTSYLHRQTITGLERQLDPGRFLRIHRSVIVNIDKIRELRPWPTGEYVVLMRNGKELTLSRTYRSRLCSFVGEACPVANSKEDQPISTIREFRPKSEVADDGSTPNKDLSNPEFARRTPDVYEGRVG